MRAAAAKAVVRVVVRVVVVRVVVLVMLVVVMVVAATGVRMVEAARRRSRSCSLDSSNRFVKCHP